MGGLMSSIKFPSRSLENEEYDYKATSNPLYVFRAIYFYGSSWGPTNPIPYWIVEYLVNLSGEIIADANCDPNIDIAMNFKHALGIVKQHYNNIVRFGEQLEVYDDVIDLISSTGGTVKAIGLVAEKKKLSPEKVTKDYYSICGIFTQYREREMKRMALYRDIVHDVRCYISKTTCGYISEAIDAVAYDRDLSHEQVHEIYSEFGGRITILKGGVPVWPSYGVEKEQESS
jgi:hypothetical protein